MKLPNFLGQIMALLKMKDSKGKVYAGLQGLRALTARYEFEMDDEREPLDEIIRQSFPILGMLGSEIISNKENEDAL